MGLSALALENTPYFPTYPNRMSPADVSAGLVLPNAAVALLGSGGAAATLLLIFMAVTSAMSAELIAVSSIWTYDIYKTYINPDASGRRLIYMSHACCVVYAILMAAFSTGLHYAGISMGYLYLLMGVIISGAVLPSSLTLLWSRQSWAAATFSPPLALCCSVTGWLVQAKQQYGELNVTTTGSNYPMLVGNVVSLLAPMIFVPVLSLVFKNPKYDWMSMKLIRKGDDHDIAAAARVDLETLPGERSNSVDEAAKEQIQLQRSAKIARYMTVFMTLAFLVLWPMPMYGSGYIFSKNFFTGWVVVAILWLFCSSFCVGLYPLWEGRKTSLRTMKLIWKDVRGQGKPIAAHGRPRITEDDNSNESEQQHEKKEVTTTPPQVEIKH